ncbi:MAG: hypothetical protein KBT34_10260 [Prevotella sp.]|nr:hypothetical protein [Candidatus Prevotella equi]
MIENKDMRKRSHLTAYDKMFIIENIDTLTLSEIARQLGFTVGAIQRAVHKMFPDYKRRRLVSRWTPERAQQLMAMWNEGCRCKEIADKIYVAENSIPSILRHVSDYYGLPFEPRFRRTR